MIHPRPVNRRQVSPLEPPARGRCDPYPGIRACPGRGSPFGGWIRGVYPEERRAHHMVYPERSRRAQGRLLRYPGLHRHEPRAIQACGRGSDLKGTDGRPPARPATPGMRPRRPVTRPAGCLPGTRPWLRLTWSHLAWAPVARRADPASWPRTAPPSGGPRRRGQCRGAWWPGDVSGPGATPVDAGSR